EMSSTPPIAPLQAPRTLDFSGMKIVCPIEHQRIIIPLVLPTWHGAFELLGPARPAHFFKQDWQQGAEPLWGDTIENVAHLCVGGHLGHAKKRFEVAPPP